MSIPKNRNTCTHVVGNINLHFLFWANFKIVRDWKVSFRSGKCLIISTFGWKKKKKKSIVHVFLPKNCWHFHGFKAIHIRRYVFRQAQKNNYRENQFLFLYITFKINIANVKFIYLIPFEGRRSLLRGKKNKKNVMYTLFSSRE